MMCATGMLRNPSMLLKSLPTVCSCHLRNVEGSEDIVCESLLATIDHCRKYLSILHCCWDNNGDISANGKDKISVVRAHFLAMLQCHLMDVELDIWAMLTSRSISTLEQFSAILDYIMHRFGYTFENSKSVPTLKQIKFGLIGNCRSTVK